MEQKTKCNNAECDFCCDNVCLYGGTAEINPNPLTPNQCRAFEPVDYFGILIDKMQTEYDAFIEELSRMRPEQIIDKAYEKVFKEDILAAIKDKSLLFCEAKALCNEEHPLDCVYKEWLGNDFSYMDMVRDTISETVKKLMVGKQRLEWNYTEIKDQASFNALVKYFEDAYTGCNMNLIKEVKFTDIMGEKYGCFMDTYFSQEGWQLLLIESNGIKGYQVFFGHGLQVDNRYEYGFPYMFSLEEVKAFAEDFYKRKCA